MIVIVLKASIYAGPEWISLPFAEEGETIDIQDGWYAQAMIDGGYVTLPVKPAAEAVPVVEPEAAKKKATK